MKTQKKLRNFKVFAPKRKFNQPKGARAISPGDAYGAIIDDGYEVIVTNISKRPIYVRYE
jgi:hypothetical protein